jgi:hypothetical protein
MRFPQLAQSSAIAVAEARNPRERNADRSIADGRACRIGGEICQVRVLPLNRESGTFAYSFSKGAGQKA